MDFGKRCDMQGHGVTTYSTRGFHFKLGGGFDDLLKILIEKSFVRETWATQNLPISNPWLSLLGTSRPTKTHNFQPPIRNKCFDQQYRPIIVLY